LRVDGDQTRHTNYQRASAQKIPDFNHEGHPMENEQLFDQMVQLLGELVTTAGPEWTLQFLQAGIEEAGAGGQMQPEMMSQGGPQAMPMRPQAPRNALSGQ
jgi:hypothetical protein